MAQNIFQLGINKAGVVRGNYFNTADEVTQQIQGAVDKVTQRISWIVADRKKIVFDTGLYNLTKKETPVLGFHWLIKGVRCGLRGLVEPPSDPYLVLRQAL